MSAGDAVRARLVPSAKARALANAAFGEALGRAASDEAPLGKTGRLKATLLTGFNQSNATGVGSIAMPYYGQIVRKGSPPHAIPNAFGRGIEVQHPGHAANDFLARAMQHPEVAAFKRRLPMLLLGYPTSAGRGQGRFSKERV